MKLRNKALARSIKYNCNCGITRVFYDERITYVCDCGQVV